MLLALVRKTNANGFSSEVNLITWLKFELTSYIILCYNHWWWCYIIIRTNKHSFVWKSVFIFLSLRNARNSERDWWTTKFTCTQRRLCGFSVEPLCLPSSFVFRETGTGPILIIASSICFSTFEPLQGNPFLSSDILPTSDSSEFVSSPFIIPMSQFLHCSVS